MEIACGGGYPVTRGLVDAGLEIWAIDSSPTLVSEFRSRFHAVPIRCESVQDNDFFLSACESGLQGLGYCTRGEFGIPGRRYYTKGQEERTHHLHAFEFGSPEVAVYTRFRDFLRESGKDAEAYVALKIGLASQFRDDPHGYRDAKSALIRSIDQMEQKRDWPDRG